MYPKNAASPERIAIGPVVLIADGTVQTSGVSVKVLPFGTTASAGGGTIAYEEGIVHYTPTQAETNYTSFILIAYKTGCIPASVTIVTTASAVAGYAAPDWAVIRAPTTTVNLSGTTISTSQAVASVSGAVGSVTARVTANTDQLAGQTVTAAAGVTFPTSVASPTNITAGTITTVTNLTNAPTAGDFTATMKTSIGTAVAASAVASVTGAVGSVTGLTASDVAAIKAKTDNLPTDPADQSAVEAAILAAFTTAMTESYRTNGATGSPAQLLYEIAAHLGESAIAGTTKTIKKIDHSTTAATFTLDDATTPTSVTRAT